MAKFLNNQFNYQASGRTSKTVVAKLGNFSHDTCTKPTATTE